MSFTISDAFARAAEALALYDELSSRNRLSTKESGPSQATLSHETEALEDEVPRLSHFQRKMKPFARHWEPPLDTPLDLAPSSVTQDDLPHKTRKLRKFTRVGLQAIQHLLEDPLATSSIRLTGLRRHTVDDTSIASIKPKDDDFDDETERDPTLSLATTTGNWTDPFDDPNISLALSVRKMKLFSRHWEPPSDTALDSPLEDLHLDASLVTQDDLPHKTRKLRKFTRVGLPALQHLLKDSVATSSLRLKGMQRHTIEDNLTTQDDDEKERDPTLSTTTGSWAAGFDDPDISLAHSVQSDRWGRSLAQPKSTPQPVPQKQPNHRIDVRIHPGKKNHYEMLYDADGLITNAWSDESHNAKLMLCVKSGISPKKSGRIGIFTQYHPQIQAAAGRIGLTAFMNGITVDADIFQQYGEVIYQKLNKRTPVIGLHNDTYGAIPDVASLAIKSFFTSVRTPSISVMKLFLETLADHFYSEHVSIQSSVSVLLIVHSEGGLVLENAFKQTAHKLHQVLQKHLYIIALGSVCPIPRKRGNQKNRDISVINIYSKKDYATLPYLTEYDPEDYNIKVVSCASDADERIVWVIDHAFLSKTYQKHLTGHINLLAGRIGIGQV